MVAKTVKKSTETLTIAPPNIEVMEISIVGTAPYVQNRFSNKSAMQILQKHIAGSTAKGKKVTEARDIEQDFKDATHMDAEGHYGIPAAAFRSAMISACRLVGFQMTKAKLSVFVEADSIDKEDGSPLVYIEGKPEMHKAHVRLESGVTSVAIRPMWRDWSAKVKVKWDADQFTKEDLINLLSRAGIQVGIGEGRPDSKKSHGMGWGVFEVTSG